MEVGPLGSELPSSKFCFLIDYLEEDSENAGSNFLLNIKDVLHGK